MNQENPLLLLVIMGAALIIFRWWWQDFANARHDERRPRPLPGATPASWPAIAAAAVGALLLLSGETFAEKHLGVAGEQSRITWLFGIYTLSGAFTEELIFRGFLVVEHRGRSWLVASVVFASFLFAALHPFLWDWKAGSVELHFTRKAWLSTTAVFVGSLWFYFVRFWPLNPTRSLWPCIAAHLAKNLGVLVIKHAQGFVSGWW